MLKPNKHTNPKLSILNAGAVVISELQENEVLEYSDLLNKLKKTISEKIVEDYNYILSFLFLIGKIEYLPDKDCFRLK